MKKLLSVMAIALLSTHAFAGKEEFSAIYGDYDNQFVDSRTVSGDIHEIGSGIALVVRPTVISEYTSSSIKIKGVPLRDVVLNRDDVQQGKSPERMCAGEPMREEMAAAGVYCTAFLISETQVMTAGHCVYSLAGTNKNSGMSERTMCERMNFVFGVRKQRVISDGFEVNKENHYKCSKIEKVFSNDGDVDFAVIKLDRPVKARFIFKLGNDKKMENGDDVYLLGHPLGIALSYGSGSIVSSYGEVNLKANLDAFGGNSGSPVMNYATNEVVGILTGGNDDFEVEAGKSCQNLARYDNRFGDRVLRMSVINQYRK